MTHTPIPKEEIELFRQLKDLKVIFDVGARTDVDYLEIWPESQHYLFEPNPEFFKELQEKIEGKTNVHALNYGLGDRNGEMGYQNGLQSFVDSWITNNPKAEGNVVLTTKTLDTYIHENDIEQIDFLKIDTEGYEIKVLLGATGWFHIIKFIQYEHWGKYNNLMIKGLLSEDFDTYDVGYRNMFCMNKNLVSEEERNGLSTYITEHKLAELV